MKLPPSKADIRKQLQEHTDAYLQHGGTVSAVPRGASGRDGNNGPVRQSTFVANEGRQVAPEDQLPLNDVIQSIESRRKAKSTRSTSSSKAQKPKPKRKMIYDDFGEPLRWEWVEE